MSRTTLLIGYDLEVHVDTDVRGFTFEIPPDHGRAAAQADIDIEQAMTLMEYLDKSIKQMLALKREAQS